MIDKRKITMDWQELLPELNKRKMLELSNRLGPLVVNILLKMGRGGTFYTPTYFVHNLCNDIPVDSLRMTLVKNTMTIDISAHDKEYKAKAAQLLSEVYIPIRGDIKVEEIIDGYNRYFKKALFVSRHEYEDYILMCGWAGSSKLIEQALQKVQIEVSKWPEERYVSLEEGGVKKWLNNMEEKAYDREKLILTAQNEAKRLKVDKLPQRQIIF